MKYQNILHSVIPTGMDKASKHRCMYMIHVENMRGRGGGGVKDDSERTVLSVEAMATVRDFTSQRLSSASVFYLTFIKNC